MEEPAQSETREGASESETPRRTPTEEYGEGLHDSSAITSVYGTPKTQCSFSSSDSSASPTFQQRSTSTRRNKSSIDLDKYEQALKEQKEAIKERNDLIKQLTERLRATAGEQNQLLKEEHERIRELEMELGNVKRKQSLGFDNSHSPNKLTQYLEVNSNVNQPSAVMQERSDTSSREISTLREQVETLRHQLARSSEEASFWKSKSSETGDRLRLAEERSRGIEIELSEVKTQLIWASEEHEQMKVNLQMRESELNRAQQDLNLKNESLVEAMARLEALRKFETESTVLQRSLQQLKNELNQSQNLNRSLREQLGAQSTIMSVNDSISEQTQYFEIPSATSVGGSLTQAQRNEVLDLLDTWSDCQEFEPVESVDDLIKTLGLIREYVLSGRAQLQEELDDVLKEGMHVQGLHDVVGIVQTLKAYGLQGRRVPSLEEEICTLKVKLADCEAKLDSTEKEFERLKGAECRQPFVAEIERVRQETEADMAQKLYALQTENLQLQHKRTLLEAQVANFLNSSAQETAEESSQTMDHLQEAVLRLHSPTSTRNSGSSPVSNASDDPDRSSQDSISLNLEDSRDGIESLSEERTNLFRQINDRLEKDSRKLLKKLMNIHDRLVSSEKLIIQNEFVDKIRLAQKQTEDIVEQKYLAQIESLAAKWECDKNSALHDQLLRYLRDLSEPMTVYDHMDAIRALLEEELLEARLRFGLEQLAKKEDDEDPSEVQHPKNLYENLCDNIEKTRVHFEDLCSVLTKAINSAKDAFILKDNNRLNELETSLNEFRDLVTVKDDELGKLRSELEAVRLQMGDLLSENENLLKEKQLSDIRCLQISEVIEGVKNVLGVECEDSRLPGLIQDMVSATESESVSLKDLAKALRNGTKLAEEARRVLVSRLNDSQVSMLDMSSVSVASVSCAAPEQLANLRREYELLQQKLAQVEEQKEYLENASFASQMEVSGCEVKLSDSLIKLVGELRHEKLKTSELQRRLNETLPEEKAPEPKSALQSNHRLLSILSDVVKTCVSCEQDIVRVLQDTGALSVDYNHTIPLIDEEEPLPSLGSTLNTSREEGLNGPYPSNQELNQELMEDVMELPISLGSLADGSNDPQDDMVLVPSRRLKASVSQMVDYVKTSNSHWSSKVRELEENLEKLEGELQEEKSARMDFAEQLMKAKENVIGLDETRERLFSELQLTLGKLHEAEHQLQEDAGTKRKLQDRLRDLEHMKFVRDRQDQIIESNEAVKSLTSQEENAEQAELSEENSRLEKENFTLTRSCQREISLRDEQISALQARLEEVNSDREDIEEKVQSLLREKDQQLEAMDRQLQQSKKFFHDISQEKDAECEALEREIRNLKETLAKEQKRRSTTGENQRDQLESMEHELKRKSSDMEFMVKKRSELETELQCAKEKIDDLREVISRLEQDLTSKEVKTELDKLPEMRSLSPASESASDVLSDSLAHQDNLDMSFKVLKEQLRSKDEAVRHLEKQQSLLQEVSLRLRLMAERMQSALVSRKPGSGFEIQEPGEELLSPSSSLHLNQLKAFEDNLEKLLQMIDTLKKSDIKSKSRISQLEKEYEDHEAEIAEIRMKNAGLLNKLEKRQVDMSQPSIFASELQMQVITAEKKSEGLENELKIAETEIKKLKETKTYLEERLDSAVKELQVLRKKLTVYEECIYNNDELEISSNSSSRSSPRSSPRRTLSLKSSKDNNNSVPHKLCQQCGWMREMLDKQEIELRKLRIEAFERSVNEKRECASVCSSEMSSSPEGSHQSVQLQTSFRDSSLNRELQEEVLTLRSEKELLEHRKGVYETKCSALQSEVNHLRTMAEELRQSLSSTIPLEEHSNKLRQIEAALKKDKMDAMGELEVTWQERVEMERQMHLRVLKEKDSLIRETEESMLGHRKEKEFLSEQLQTRSKELRDLQSILASREQQVTKLEAEIQRLQGEVRKVRKSGESLVKETSLKIKETLSAKMKEYCEKNKALQSTLIQTKEQLERSEANLSLLEAIIYRRLDDSHLQRLEEAYPDCKSFDWLISCENCSKLKLTVEEAQNDLVHLRAQLKSGDSEIEWISLLHKLYWVFRRSESRCMQLLVQKSYLQNCALRSIDFPRKKRSLKTVCIVIMAVYRMKHRRLRWAMAAVAHPDKSSLVAKINPYIQNVPSSKNLRAFHAAPSAEEPNSLQVLEDLFEPVCIGGNKSMCPCTGCSYVPHY